MLYFAYGMRHSKEGRSTSYGPMISYGGDADLSRGSLARLDEEGVHQQPPLKEADENADYQEHVQ